MSNLELLFDPSLIPSSSRSTLDDDLFLRPLASTDNARGHIELLTVLTSAPALSQQTYASTFQELKAALNTYFVIVIVQRSTDKIVGCGSLVVERKFLRNAGLVGHIEDIAVSKSMQGRKLGLKIINTLEDIGKGVGCYKIILDCSQSNIPFYEKCG
ncbi:hypothetical protein TREMEDRAFT_34108 [Tremella mesenterica DSM 1558]|nr:uncharacterized protein TREMEDRAFT_34108 [Tremella mesenterica DSM 1558]EIW66865.1 hypothetical protein TREMEDRAFT_34108 [Tremella mesenterica DSM 1558]